MRRRLFATLGVVTLFLTGCTIGPSDRPDLAVYGGGVAPPAGSTEASTPPPTGPGGPGQEAQFDDDWAPCDSGIPAGDLTLECTSLDVQKQYGPGSSSRDTLNLQVARAAAAGLPADAPTLVLLVANGPADSGMAGVSRLADVAATLPSEITSTYRLVTFDIRGSGDSVQLSCIEGDPLEQILTLPLDPSGEVAASTLATTTRDFTFACEDYAGPDIVAFNTTNIADDVDSLRSALGLQTLNILGVGYGASIATVYVDRYPARVGRVVADAPEDHLEPASTRALTAAAEYEKRLDTFAAACAAESSCPLGDTARQQIAQLAGDLEARPVRADNGLRVNGGTILMALTLALPNSDLWPELGDALYSAVGSDVSAITDLLDELIGPYGEELALRMVIDCNDTAERTSAADLAASAAAAVDTAPLFGPYLVGWAGLCSSWPAPDEPLGGLRGQGAPPVLVIGGAGDPVSTYVGTQAVANQLASATLLTWQGGDHGSYTRSTCISGAATGYLLTGQIPSGGTVCPA